MNGEHDAMAAGRQPIGYAGIQAGLGVLGSSIMAALAWQFFEVYFAIGGTVPTAAPSDGLRYLVTAGLGVAVVAASLVLALLRRKVLAVVCSLALAIGMFGFAYVLAVPQNRWNQDPVQEPLPADYRPCFSGSNDCPGG